jgi:phage tail tape-measure protein
MAARTRSTSGSSFGFCPKAGKLAKAAKRASVAGAARDMRSTPSGATAGSLDYGDAGKSFVAIVPQAGATDNLKKRMKDKG